MSVAIAQRKRGCIIPRAFAPTARDAGLERVKNFSFFRFQPRLPLTLHLNYLHWARHPHAAYGGS